MTSPASREGCNHDKEHVTTTKVIDTTTKNLVTPTSFSEDYPDKASTTITITAITTTTITSITTTTTTTITTITTTTTTTTTITTTTTTTTITPTTTITTTTITTTTITTTTIHILIPSYSFLITLLFLLIPFY